MQEEEAEAIIAKMEATRRNPASTHGKKAWGAPTPSADQWQRSSVGHPLKRKQGAAYSASLSPERRPASAGPRRRAGTSSVGRKPAAGGKSPVRPSSAKPLRKSRGARGSQRLRHPAPELDDGADEYVRELESQVDDLRRSVEMLQVQMKKQSSGVNSKVAKLVKEHEANLDVIEQLVEQKQSLEAKLQTVASGGGGGGGESKTESKAEASAAPAAAGWGGLAAEEDDGEADQALPSDDDEPAAAASGKTTKALETKYSNKVGASSGVPPEPVGGKDDAGEDKAREAEDEEGGDAALRAGAEREGDWQDDVEWAERVRSAYLQDEQQRDRTLRGPNRGGKSPRGKGGRDRPLTEPKPFYAMVTREQLAPKTIAQRKAEAERKAREEEEEKMLRSSFKAREVPKSTLKPRFQAMLEQMEARRAMNVSARVEALKAASAPFKGILTREEESKRKREQKLKQKQEEEQRQLEETLKNFRAKPIPAAVSAAKFHEMNEQQERARKERVKERAVTLLASSQLPPRMQMWAAQAEQKKKAEEEAAPAGKGRRKGRKAAKGAPAPQKWEKDLTFKPAVNTRVPDFKRLHGRWDRSLNAARRGKVPTRARAFSFDSEERKQAEAEKRRKRDMEALAAEEAAKRAAMPRTRRPSARAAPPAVTSTTKATELRLKQVQERLQREREEEERRAREDARRAQRQKEASKALKPVIKAMEKERLTEPLIWHASGDEVAAARMEEQRRAAKRDFRQRQKEMRASIDAAAAKRPFLFQRHEIEMEAAAARRTALLNVAENVKKARSGDDSGSAGGGAGGAAGGGSDIDDDDLFDDEERELMGGLDDGDAEDA